MKCLITGAGGFIGGQITRRLLEEGHQVVTYQRGKYPDLLQLEGTHLQGSIDQLGPLSDAMKGVDTVVLGCKNTVELKECVIAEANGPLELDIIARIDAAVLPN